MQWCLLVLLIGDSHVFDDVDIAPSLAVLWVDWYRMHVYNLAVFSAPGAWCFVCFFQLGCVHVLPDVFQVLLHGFFRCRGL